MNGEGRNLNIMWREKRGQTGGINMWAFSPIAQQLIFLLQREEKRREKADRSMNQESKRSESYTINYRTKK